MRLVDQEGNVLDATFDVESAGLDRVDIVLHARYGGRSSARRTNVDYFPALELLLRRLAAIEVIVSEITVDSKPALRLPVKERVLDLPFPVQLRSETDVVALRRSITSAQRIVARSPTAQPGGGNNHKRIRLALRAGHGALDVASVEAALTAFADLSAGDRLGREYQVAKADPSVAPADVFTFDPAIRERALAAHASVQNGLADRLRSLGIQPRSPRLGEPDFDISWLGRSGIVVAEVKSLTATNEDQQLRLGLGQVLHYRHQLSKLHGKVDAVLALEHKPSDLWLEVCASVEVTLTWPPEWPGVD